MTPSTKRLAKKALAVDLTLGGASFAGSANRKSVRGLAVSAQVSKAGLPAMNRAVVDIYNMKMDDVERISTTSPRSLNIEKNVMEIRAGLEGEAMATVFKGEIHLAYGIFPGPDSGIHIEALSGIHPATEALEPHTQEGQVSGLEIIRQYADAMGYAFHNNGVRDKLLTDPAINGGPMAKVRQAARHMDVQIISDDGAIIVQPWEAGIGETVEVDPESGLIGYPFFNADGVSLRHEWHPGFRQGGLIRIARSRVSRAVGLWKIVKLEHYLQCFGAGPLWDTYLEGVKIG